MKRLKGQIRHPSRRQGKGETASVYIDCDIRCPYCYIKDVYELLGVYRVGVLAALLFVHEHLRVSEQCTQF